MKKIMSVFVAIAFFSTLFLLNTPNGFSEVRRVAKVKKMSAVGPIPNPGDLPESKDFCKAGVTPTCAQCRAKGCDCEWQPQDGELAGFARCIPMPFESAVQSN